MFIWLRFNPVSRLLSRLAPWWVVLETKGCRSGKARRVPLARGPLEGNATWVIAVHGRHASFVRNILADPNVRIKLGRRWHDGVAEVVPMRQDVLKRFSRYARSGPRHVGIDSCLIRIDLARGGSSA
jgi:deazaflavin-dependent oxidoreductase (nitroreductase family)